MLAPRTKKVLADLWHNKARSALVILSITTGVFSVGMVAGSRQTLLESMAHSYKSAAPANATLYLRDPFNEDLVETVRRFKGVAEAQARRNLELKAQIPGKEEWKAINLVAIPDFKDIRINKVKHLSGRWPPAQDEVLLDQSAQEMLGAKPGDRIVVETPSRKRRTLTISGLVHDLSAPPTFFTGRIEGFISMDTVEALGEEPKPDMLLLTMDTVAGAKLDKKVVQAVVKDVRNRLDASALFVVWAWVPPPGQHPVQDPIDTLILIMSALGVLVLVLSGFLLVNTISAILTQQTRQIGVMKSVGATSWDIARLYLTVVLAYCAASVGLAIPLGAFAARGAVSWLGGLLNLEVADFNIPKEVLAGEFLLGFLIPTTAALFPIFSAARITVREAVGFSGVSGAASFGGNFIDRVVAKVSFLSRPALLSLRNTFRRKGRLALTLATLTMGGATFMAVYSVRLSMVNTIESALQYFNYDVEVYFNRPYRADRVLQEANAVEGVAAAECWGFSAAQIVQDWNGKGESRVLMMAPPAETKMLRPTLVAGRWLLPDDENAVVINTDVLKNNPEIAVGSRIKIRLGLHKTEWLVVGMVRGVLSGPWAYVNRPYFSFAARTGGSTSAMQLMSTSRDPAEHQKLADRLQARFKLAGMQVSSVGTTNDFKERMVRQFSVIMAFLLLMGALMAFVGGLALMGTMGINVLERTREIGVIRSVGATTTNVLTIFILEGVTIGLISWVLGTLLAIPIGQFMCFQVGMMFSRAPFPFAFSLEGVGIWFVFMVVLSTLASILPAISAARLSVREVLAAE